jgi:hypothetical protein
MKRILFLVAAMVAITANAQTLGLQPFTELQVGVVKSQGNTLPTYGAIVGLRSGDLTVGLRYRSTLSLLHESSPQRDVSLLLQYAVQVAPRLELYGGVATGFVLEHARLAHSKPLDEASRMELGAEVNLGLHYYLSDNVALTFNLGVGSCMGANDWRALAKQLPYDPRTLPTYTTATGGVRIGIPPKVKKINMPEQLIVEGSSPILTSRD